MSNDDDLDSILDMELEPEYLEESSFEKINDQFHVPLTGANKDNSVVLAKQNDSAKQKPVNNTKKTEKKKRGRKALIKNSEHRKIRAAKRKFKCEFCGEGSLSILGLENHLRKNHGRLDWYCYHCAINFGNNARALYHHILATHQKQEYQCDECRKEITSCGDLKLHKEEVHNGNDRFTCMKCKISDMSYIEFYDHCNSLHATTRDFSCVPCGFKTEDYKEFKEHKYLEHGKKYCIIQTFDSSDQENYLDENVGVLVKTNEAQETKKQVLER